MSFGLIAGLTIAVSAAPAEKPPLQHAMMGVSNGCFVETVAFLDHWGEAKGAESWVRLLQWGAREEDEVVMGHAVAVCDAGGTLWSWDINYGWAKLPLQAAQKENAAVVAEPVLKKYPKVNAQFPTYRFDFEQPPGAPPNTSATTTNPSLRDAIIAGAKLARHRPVNVVRFTFPEGDAKHETAAVVFLFHGRYCVYVPELGTVPFRVRAGVENLRVIQELLRRAFPGAGDLQKL